jgi:hypothetical protein
MGEASSSSDETTLAAKFNLNDNPTGALCSGSDMGAFSSCRMGKRELTHHHSCNASVASQSNASLVLPS